jgi:hypothetical protein
MRPKTSVALAAWAMWIVKIVLFPRRGKAGYEVAMPTGKVI